MSIRASIGDGVFLGDGGVFQECCCHVVFLSIKRAADAESIIFAVEDGGNAGHVKWVREIDPQAGGGWGAETITSLWWANDLYVALRPASSVDPSVLRINASTGVISHSLALTQITGGARIADHGIAVNSLGQVFVAARGSHTALGRDFYRLTPALVLEQTAQLGGGVVDVDLGDPLNGHYLLLGPQRMLSIIGDGMGISGGPVWHHCFRVNADLTIPVWFEFGQYRWLNEMAGSAPSAHRGGPDVLIADGNGNLYNHTSFNGPKTLIGTVRGTFANNRVGAFQSGNAWVPGSGNSIRKYDLSGPNLVHTKVIGTDFLIEGTWGETTTKLDLLRRNDDIWVLAQDRDAGNPRAILAVFHEDGTTWTEKWRLDLMTDEDVAWEDPTAIDHWRGWVMNSPGQGVDDF